MQSRPLYVGPLLHLRTLPAFAALTPSQLRDLAYEAQEVLLPRGSALLEEGEAVAAMYLIVDGFVDVAGGGEVGPGGVVGFLEVLSAAPVSSGAEGSTDVVALRVESDALRDVCEQNFAVLTALLRYVAELVADDPTALVRSIAGRGAPELSDPEPMDRVRRIVALHRAPAFPTRHMDALAELAGHLEEHRLEAGVPLWGDGEEAAGFFLVASGQVAFGAPGRPTVELGAGAVPGLVETLAGRTHRYSATTTQPSLLLRVDVDPFMDVVEDHFEMAFGLVGWLARHLIESSSGTERGSWGSTLRVRE